MTTIGSNQGLQAYYQSLIKKQQGLEEDDKNKTNNSQSSSKDVITSIDGSISNAHYTHNGEDFIAEYNKILFGLSNTTDTKDHLGISKEDIFSTINKVYPELIGEKLDRATLENIVDLAYAFAQEQGKENIDEIGEFVHIGVELALAAGEKGVDKTEYIASRIIDFDAMREINSSLSIEDMNEILANNQTLNMLSENLQVAFAAAGGENFANNDLSYTEKAEVMLTQFSDNKAARLAFYETQSATYLAYAHNGSLSNADYYSGIKSDLLQTFPGFSEMNMDAVGDLTSRIESLSPEEIEEFQKAIINLPTSSESDYKAELDKFLEEFNAKTEGKEAYVLADKNEIKSFDDIFKARYDKEYNADEIIKHRDNQNILSSILELEAQKNNINSILDSATTEEAASEAIFTALFTLSGSSDDKELTKLLQEMLGRKDVSIKNGKVIIEEQVASRGASSSSSGSVLELRDELKGKVNSNTNEVIKELKTNVKPESGSMFGAVGDWFNEACTEYVAPIIEGMGLSSDTYDTASIVGGIATVGLVAAGFFTGGATWFLAAGAAGAIASGASFAGELQDINNAVKNGEISLYDENGNWAPDEQAQAKLNNMDKNAALAVIDLLSAGAGAKVANMVKGGKWATAAISNGINGVANITGATALTGDGDLGSNTIAAGVGMLFDIKLSTANDFINGGERAWDNLMKKLSGEDSFKHHVTSKISLTINDYSAHLTKVFSKYGEGLDGAANDFFNAMLKEIADGNKLSATNTSEILESILKKYNLVDGDGNILGGANTNNFIDACLDYLKDIVGNDFAYLMRNDDLNRQAYQEMYNRGMRNIIVNNTLNSSEVDNIIKTLLDAGYDGKDDTIIKELLENADIDWKYKDDITEMLKDEFNKQMRMTRNAYGFDNNDQIKLAGDFSNKIKELVLEGKNIDEIKAFLQKSVEDGDLDSDLYERVMKYCLDDPELNKAMKDKNMSSGQLMTLAATVASTLGLTFSTDANASNNNSPQDEDIIIDGGELPGITVDGKAGENVTIKGDCAFIAITDPSGNIYYRVQDQEGNVSYVSTEAFDKLFKDAKPEDIGKLLNEHGVTNPEDVSEDLIGFDWDAGTKAAVLTNLQLIFGTENNYSIAFNFDGSINFAVIDPNGKIIFGLDGFDPNKPLVPDGKDLEDIINTFKDMAKNATPAAMDTLPEIQGWKSLFGQAIINTYGQDDGYLDTNSMVEDWDNAGGEVITFTNNGDGSWSTSYGYNTGINYGGTYGGGSYSGGYYTGGFDVFATGGGSSSGSASFDAFCEAMLAGWREMMVSKGESVRDKRVHAQLVCQPQAHE